MHASKPQTGKRRISGQKANRGPIARMTKSWKNGTHKTDSCQSHSSQPGRETLIGRRGVLEFGGQSQKTAKKLVGTSYGDWNNLINTQETNEVPKVADFLGVSKSDNQSELVSYNEIHSNDSDYLFSSNSLVPVQHTLANPATGYDNLSENGCNMQQLTLSMGSGIGGYDKEEKAARAYDLVALKYWGTSTTTNFLHHQHGRWQARIGRVAGNKDLYLGTFSTEEEAAEAYDIAAINNTLPIGGGAAKRLKEAQAIESSRKREEIISLGSTFQYGAPSGPTLQAAVPLMQHPFDSQPLLTLQNQADLSQYNNQDASSHYQSYIQTQLQLHQQQPCSYNINQANATTQLYGNYLQNNPVLLHGLMNMGSSSSSVMDHHNGSSSGSYSGGFLGNGLGMGSSSGSGGNGGGSAEELALVKVDYDQTGTYTGWSGETVRVRTLVSLACGMIEEYFFFFFFQMKMQT
ncbi:hypothetical protein DH2020_001049 [Rehmannia glutinosa]|uniref:AP2/ERF domain-containing protein n=1 Tax=Rehmannia glutinosa TaxID=99300 RepID=A0ABR0XY86_REHGL